MNRKMQVVKSKLSESDIKTIVEFLQEPQEPYAKKTVELVNHAGKKTRLLLTTSASYQLEQIKEEI